MAAQGTVTALLHGPDRRGLVARVAGWIFERDGNIVHADQHRDMEQGIFFQRVEWAPGAETPAVEAAAFERFARELDMHAVCRLSDDRPSIAIFVSRDDHCFHELFLGLRSGDLPGEVGCVISNHPDLEQATRDHGAPYHHVAVTRETKPAAEARQLQLLREHDVQLVVLARYMQILSAEFLRQLQRPVINIHHSFLPAFAGGRPYHQAHSRGVKLIGATAHYATPDLDDGPIIQQDVVRVSHRHGVQDLIRRGKILERHVLAQAVKWHLENRILVYGNKTVVFD